MNFISVGIRCSPLISLILPLPSVGSSSPVSSLFCFDVTRIASPSLTHPLLCCLPSSHCSLGNPSAQCAHRGPGGAAPTLRMLPVDLQVHGFLGCWEK